MHKRFTHATAWGGKSNPIYLLFVSSWSYRSLRRWVGKKCDLVLFVWMGVLPSFLTPLQGRGWGVMCSISCALSNDHRWAYTHSKSLLVFILCNICLLLFYVLATSEVISEWVPTCDSAHSWQFYSATPLGNQATSTMTCIPLSHIILTLSQPVLALS